MKKELIFEKDWSDMEKLMAGYRQLRRAASLLKEVISNPELEVLMLKFACKAIKEEKSRGKSI